VSFSATWKAATHPPTTTELGEGVIEIARDALAAATFGTIGWRALQRVGTTRVLKRNISSSFFEKTIELL
jgi:hypothetical protein